MGGGGGGEGMRPIKVMRSRTRTLPRSADDDIFIPRAGKHPLGGSLQGPNLISYRLISLPIAKLFGFQITN